MQREDLSSDFIKSLEKMKTNKLSSSDKKIWKKYIELCKAVLNESTDEFTRFVKLEYLTQALYYNLERSFNKDREAYVTTRFKQDYGAKYGDSLRQLNDNGHTKDVKTGQYQQVFDGNRENKDRVGVIRSMHNDILALPYMQSIKPAGYDALSGSHNMLLTLDARDFDIINAKEEAPKISEGLKKSFKQELNREIEAPKTQQVGNVSKTDKEIKPFKGLGVLSFLSKKPQIEETKCFIFDPKIAGELYKKVTAANSQALNGVDNYKTPAKFTQALQLAGFSFEKVDFNGTNGYIVKAKESEIKKLEAFLSTPQLKITIPVQEAAGNALRK